MKNTPSRAFFALWVLLASWLGGLSAQAQMATVFIGKHGTFNGTGSYWYQEFTFSGTNRF